MLLVSVSGPLCAQKGRNKEDEEEKKALARAKSSCSKRWTIESEREREHYEKPSLCVDNEKQKEDRQEATDERRILKKRKDGVVRNVALVLSKNAFATSEPIFPTKTPQQNPEKRSEKRKRERKVFSPACRKKPRKNAAQKIPRYWVPASWCSKECTCTCTFLTPHK